MASDLRDRLIGIQKYGGKKTTPPCTTILFINQLDEQLRAEDPDDDAADILRVLIEDSNTSIQLLREEMMAVGMSSVVPAESSIRRHRKQGCRCPQRSPKGGKSQS